MSRAVPLAEKLAVRAKRSIAAASTFVVGGPQNPKDPGFGGFSPLAICVPARALRLGQKRLRHAELENPTPRLFG